MAFTQDNRQIAIKTELGKDAVLLRSLIGTEWVSEPFRFELELLAQNQNLDVAPLLGRPATISMRVPGKNDRTFERFIHGLITRVTQTGLSGDFMTLRADLRPALSLLDQTLMSRIYQKMTVPDIVQK